MLTHDQITTALALLQTGSTPINVARTLARLRSTSILGLDRMVKDLHPKVKSLDDRTRFQVLGAVYVERQGGLFLMHTADRTEVLTDEFLARCDKDWAEELRGLMVRMT